MREAIAAELGVQRRVTDRGSAAAARARTWAERAGRHGQPDYQFGDVSRSAVRCGQRLFTPLAVNRFGDVSRSAVRALAQAARGAVGRRSGAEGEALGPPDKAGALGKRSDHLGQWRVRFFSLHGRNLAWSPHAIHSSTHSHLLL